MTNKPPAEHLHFSGHETFPFRYGWLKKGVDALQADPGIFLADDATTRLGVGKNMVRSIRYWCLATGLVHEVETVGSRIRNLRVSPLGELLVGPNGFDPYLEDPATLWLLHYLICSSPGRTQTWYWAFNCWKKRQFSRYELTRDVLGLAVSSGARATEATIKRDVDCFIRTYVSLAVKNSAIAEDSLDCPLAELGLVQEMVDGENFSFQIGDHRGAHTGVFAFCLNQFWCRHFPHQETLSFEQLCYAPGSPGKVLKLSSEAISQRLEQLEEWTEGSLAYSDSTGLKQVYRRSSSQRGLEHELSLLYKSRVPVEVR